MELYPNTNKYEKPSVTVDIVLFSVVDSFEDKRKNPIRNLKILLIKRGAFPYKDTWAIPGGFINMNESLEEGAYRELQEETNITEDVYLEQLYTFGDVERDPRMRVISTSYMALTNKDNINKSKAGDDAKEALWFTLTRNYKNGKIIVSLENLENAISIKFSYDTTNGSYEFLSDEILGFDHASIIIKALERLQGKVSYTDIVFSLVPNNFTLSELQDVYELLLGEKLDKPNFRKKIIDRVVEVDTIEEEVAHRPAKLYRKK